MRLTFWGHACIALESAGVVVVLDPHAPGQFGGALDYPPIEEVADAVCCTHAHLDHAAVWALAGEPRELCAPRECFGPFDFRRVRAWHDEYRGRRRGGAVEMVIVEAEGLRLVHMSDVGQSPTPALVEAVGAIDVALVPVGGMYTIGAAQAWEWTHALGVELVVPCHYRTAQCTLPIRGVDTFVAHLKGWQILEKGSSVELDVSMLTLRKRAMLLRANRPS